MTVNFDNAASTFPKPLSVRKAVAHALCSCGGSAGRGGHTLAMRTSDAMFSARETAAEFFGAQPENTIFTSNCTHALNTAILGILKNGDHAVISSMEHNSSARPAAALAKKGIISCSVAKTADTPSETAANFISAVRPETKAIIMTAASNVTGQIMPFREVAAFAAEKNICFILDAAQAAGVIPLRLGGGISIICMPGHKGLYAAPGTGLLITDAKHIIDPLMYGGTGSRSNELSQPDYLPDRLESGTGNIAGALSVQAGIKFVSQLGIDKIYDHETDLCRIFLNQLKNNSNVIIYRNENYSYVPLVAFNIKGKTSEETADILDKKGFCLRAGLHCAPMAHKTIGTGENGAVRFSPSVFSRESEVYALCREIKKIAE